VLSFKELANIMIILKLCFTKQE